MGVAGEKRRWVEGCPATAQLKGAQGAVDRHQQEVAKHEAGLWMYRVGTGQGGSEWGHDRKWRLGMGGVHPGR